jgi:hypothetical protein
MEIDEKLSYSLFVALSSYDHACVRVTDRPYPIGAAAYNLTLLHGLASRWFHGVSRTTFW